MSPVRSSRSFGAVVLATIVVATLPTWVLVGEVEASGEIAHFPEFSNIGSSKASSQQSSLRGMGILFLDSRDSKEVVKERIRRFLSEAIGSDTPEEEHQRGVARVLRALMASDWAVPEELPQFSFKAYRHSNAGELYRAMREHPLARQSEAVCPQTCLFRQLGPEGMHIHLTRTLEGAGDTILVLKFRGAYGSTAENWEEEFMEVLDLRHVWLEQYSGLEHDRKPVGRLFSVQVFLGDSRPADEIWSLTE